jgi:hypothetical protein
MDYDYPSYGGGYYGRGKLKREIERGVLVENTLLKLTRRLSFFL